MQAWPDIKQSDDNDKVESNFVEDVSDYGKEDVFFDSDCNDHGQEEVGNDEGMEALVPFVQELMY